jgi:hypothetical protein
MSTINHLGPYKVSDIDDDILGDIVYNKKLPIIVKQMVGGKEVFAILAKDKGLKIICAGCFNHSMQEVFQFCQTLGYKGRAASHQMQRDDNQRCCC